MSASQQQILEQLKKDAALSRVSNAVSQVTALSFLSSPQTQRRIVSGLEALVNNTASSQKTITQTEHHSETITITEKNEDSSLDKEKEQSPSALESDDEVMEVSNAETEQSPKPAAASPKINESIDNTQQQETRRPRKKQQATVNSQVCREIRKTITNEPKLRKLITHGEERIPLKNIKVTITRATNTSTGYGQKRAFGFFVNVSYNQPNAVSKKTKAEAKNAEKQSASFKRN